MIKGIIQADLNNPLAVKYLEIAVKSYERVSDIFQVEVQQCITPDTLLDELKDIPDQLKNRSPQELASIHSNYRAAKRMSQGERFWAMEHDAYLRPEHEETFRMIMSKWLTKKTTLQIGMANEFWTTTPEIAQLFCNEIKNGFSRGPMALLHKVTDIHLKDKPKLRDTYWPANRFKNNDWMNKTGVGYNVSNAYNNPPVIIDAPITQILDEKYGGTVVDRPKNLYNRQVNPDMKWISLDEVQ